MKLVALTEFMDRMVWEEDGQGLVEYSLTIFLIAIVLVSSLSQVQVSLSTIYTRILEAFNETNQGTSVSPTN
ncbi:Flp family type IVb pilin [Brevibacillus sp. H7]|uniref:Flp family type IVb pilin n=1 Tax=Brevibacillus sp. H7 TaxID=3349138 RepID=UPI0038090464